MRKSHEEEPKEEPKEEPNEDDNSKDFKLISHLLDADSDNDQDEEKESEDCESMPLDEMPDPDLNEIKKTAAIFYNFKNKATNNYKCNIKYVIKK